MAEDVLKNISDRLSNTIKETNDFFNSIRAKESKEPTYHNREVVQGTKLKSLESVEAPDKKWILPYTVPAAKALNGGGNKEVFHPAPVLSGRPKGLVFNPVKTEDRGFKNEPEDLDPALQGWTEKQKKVFYKFAADSENKMRMESLRLQDEYNKQLASKLALVKNELYESNRKNLVELQEMRLERERWAIDEVETKKNLESVTKALEGLKNSYDNLSKELEEKEFQVKSLNSELSNAERLVESLRSDNSKLQKELHDKSEFVTRLQNEVADAYLRLEAETSKFASVDRDLSSVNQSRRDLHERNKQLRTELDSLILANKFMVTQKDALENRNSKLERDLTDLTKENLSLQNRLRSSEVSESSKVTALQEKVQSLSLQVKRAQIDLVASDRRVELENLHKEVKALRSNLKQVNLDNECLFKENSLLHKKLEQEKTLVKEHLNDLYSSRCRVHKLTSELKGLKENLLWATKLANQPLPSFDPPFKSNFKPNDHGPVEPANLNALVVQEPDLDKPKRRDLFAPTMFDGPDEETQSRINELESQLTELYLEKDRLESEMTRCNLGPGSPTRQRRQHFLLEGQVSETSKKINEISAEIKALYNS